MTSLAGALATAHVVKEAKLAGKVVLFGTPAEGENYLLDQSVDSLSPLRKNDRSTDDSSDSHDSLMVLHCSI